METISDYQSILIGLIETHLHKEEEIRIPRYSQIFRSDRSGNSGGIMLAVKEKTETVTLEVTQEKEIGQSLWILLDSNRSKITIGTIYARQENVTSNNELKVMYNNISKQISIAQEERQQVLILGDFNAKVGTYIEDNKPPVTERGRQLIKMAKKYDLVIINKEKEVCKRVWTRVQGQERSILDYVLTNSKLLSIVTEMIVDENKQHSAFKLEKSRKTYSDHNSILLKLVIEKQKKNRIITKYGYKKYRNKLTQAQVSGILKKDTIQESYDKWLEEVQNNIKEVDVTVKSIHKGGVKENIPENQNNIKEVEEICRQNPRKNLMQLNRQRKKLRAQYQNTEHTYEKTVIIERIKLIKEHITDKMKENRSR